MLAIIDGDVLCYQSCESRWKKKMGKEAHIITLDDVGERKPLEFSKKEDAKYLEESWDKFKEELQILLDRVFATDYVMAVKGPDNFRNLLYSDYKLNRHKDPNKQNLFVPVMRQLAVVEGLAIPAVGREADDLIRIWSNEAKRAGHPYIVCTIDKDLRCIPGLHYKMHIGLSDDERLLKISEEEALNHYYVQLLKGDSTDNIPGVPKVGDVKAAKYLSGCKTEEEFQEVVVSQYIEAYGEDWFEYLMSNGKMIHIQNHVDDYFNCLNWTIVKELL